MHFSQCLQPFRDWIVVIVCIWSWHCQPCKKRHRWPAAIEQKSSTATKRFNCTMARLYHKKVLLQVARKKTFKLSLAIAQDCSTVAIASILAIAFSSCIAQADTTLFLRQLAAVLYKTLTSTVLPFYLRSLKTVYLRNFSCCLLHPEATLVSVWDLNYDNDG